MKLSLIMTVKKIKVEEVLASFEKYLNFLEKQSCIDEEIMTVYKIQKNIKKKGMFSSKELLKNVKKI